MVESVCLGTAGVVARPRSGSGISAGGLGRIRQPTRERSGVGAAAIFGPAPSALWVGRLGETDSWGTGFGVHPSTSWPSAPARFRPRSTVPLPNGILNVPHFLCPLSPFSFPFSFLSPFYFQITVPDTLFSPLFHNCIEGLKQTPCNLRNVEMDQMPRLFVVLLVLVWGN